MEHCMIDLETLDTRPSAVFMSIGAVLFDPMTETIGETKKILVSLEDSISLNRTVSASTLRWWLNQSREAQIDVFGDFAMSKELSLKDSLRELALFIPERCYVWGNGATFDISMLENAYHTVYGKVPWNFWAIRDVRTIVDLCEGTIDRPEFNSGIPHTSLSDAVHQAKYVSKMYKTVTRSLTAGGSVDPLFR